MSTVERSTGRLPIYARLLRLRRLKITGLMSFLLLECTIAVAILLALAELVSWWAVPLLPVLVAVMVKVNDMVGGPAKEPVEAVAGSRSSRVHMQGDHVSAPFLDDRAHDGGRERGDGNAGASGSAWDERDRESGGPERAWGDRRTDAPGQTWGDRHAEAPEQAWDGHDTGAPGQAWGGRDAGTPEQAWGGHDAEAPERAWDGYDTGSPEPAWDERDTGTPERQWGESERVAARTGAPVDRPTEEIMLPVELTGRSRQRQVVMAGRYEDGVDRSEAARADTGPTWGQRTAMEHAATTEFQMITDDSYPPSEYVTDSIPTPQANTQHREPAERAVSEAYRAYDEYGSRAEREVYETQEFPGVRETAETYDGYAATAYGTAHGYAASEQTYADERAESGTRSGYPAREYGTNEHNAYDSHAREYATNEHGAYESGTREHSTNQHAALEYNTRDDAVSGYAAREGAAHDYTEYESGAPGYTARDYAERESAASGYTASDYTESGHGASGYAARDYTEHQNGVPEYAASDYTESGRGALGYAASEYTERELVAPEHAVRDYTELEQAASEYTGRDYTERERVAVDYAERQQVASEYAAREHAATDYDTREHAAVHRRTAPGRDDHGYAARDEYNAQAEYTGYDPNVTHEHVFQDVNSGRHAAIGSDAAPARRPASHASDSSAYAGESDAGRYDEAAYAGSTAATVPAFPVVQPAHAVPDVDASGRLTTHAAPAVPTGPTMQPAGAFPTQESRSTSAGSLAAAGSALTARGRSVGEAYSERGRSGGEAYSERRSPSRNSQPSQGGQPSRESQPSWGGQPSRGGEAWRSGGPELAPAADEQPVRAGSHAASYWSRVAAGQGPGSAPTRPEGAPPNLPGAAAPKRAQLFGAAVRRSMAAQAQQIGSNALGGTTRGASTRRSREGANDTGRHSRGGGDGSRPSVRVNERGFGRLRDA